MCYGSGFYRAGRVDKEVFVMRWRLFAMLPLLLLPVVADGCSVQDLLSMLPDRLADVVGPILERICAGDVTPEA